MPNHPCSGIGEMGEKSPVILLSFRALWRQFSFIILNQLLE
jgi:hypothetical protein